jgi:UDP-N-acetyl-D-glucosamine dehydrogenase
MNFYDNFTSRLKSKKIAVGVIGMGYVGLPLAILAAKKNFRVFGYERDSYRFKMLNKRKSYFTNIPSASLNVLSKKTKFFKRFSNISECDILIICLPTPLKNNKPDLSHIVNAIKLLKPQLRKGQLLILESTSYPGTTREELYEKLKSKFLIGKDFFIGFSSERINPGYNDNKIDKIPKVVSGYSSKCLNLCEKFYNNLFENVIKAKSLEDAEFSKLLENIYRSVNIGFINEMKFIADRFNLDIFEILSLSSTKPYGFSRFDPGPGVGGHCIPIDPQYLYWKSVEKGFNPEFIKLSAKINLDVTKFIYNKIVSHTKKIKKNKSNIKILILGIAYKKNLDDIRASAPKRLVDYLISKKFNFVSYSDPFISSCEFSKNIRKTSIKLSPESLKKNDIVILATDHDQFDYDLIKNNSNFIIDCRGRYSLNKKIVRG